MSRSKPWVSIVIEWENALLSEGDRCIAMLRAVRRQTEELAARVNAADAGGAGPVGARSHPTFELLVVFDSRRSRGAELSAMFERTLGGATEVLRWRLAPVSDSGYYSKKHHGATMAAGEIVAFMDSDVIPEPDWLERLLDPLSDPGVQVVAGNTYIDPVGLVGKTFAMTWFFPLRSDTGASRRGPLLFANNLAIRRDVYLEHPFPEIHGSSRGACLLFADELERSGIAVVHNPLARAAHPAPNGFAHVSLRALAQGRDRVLRERTHGSRWSASWLASVSRLVRHQAGVAWKVSTTFWRVGLNPLLIPAAYGLAAYYYFLYWVGETMLQLRVPAIRRIRV
ncbi:MAG: glycosyltransferase [Vicinamibacterales bacterium]